MVREAQQVAAAALEAKKMARLPGDFEERRANIAKFISQLAPETYEALRDVTERAVQPYIEAIKDVEPALRARELFQAWSREQRQGQDSERARFLRDQGDRLKPRPTPAELEDLGRRLREAVEQLSPDGKEIDAALTKPAPTPLLADAWQEFAQAAKAKLDAQPDSPRVVRSDESKPPTFSDLKELAEFPVLNLIDAALLARVQFAFVWPGVVREWRRDRGAERTKFPVPTALTTGRGAIAPIFGDRQGYKQAALIDGGKGKVLRVTVVRESAQIDFLLPSRVDTGENPTPNQILEAIQRAASNRAWRMFMACFAAADQDAQQMQGRFWYTPSRFGDLLGYAREGRTARFSADRIKEIDSDFNALSFFNLTADVSKGGHKHKFTAARLVYDAHLEDRELPANGDKPSAKHEGRRRRLLYRLSDFLLDMMNPPGSRFEFPYEILKTPRGVNPRTWDDAFKVYTLLAGHARTNATKAKGAAEALPWTWTLAQLVERANVAGENLDERKARQKVRDLLDLLTRQGWVGFELEGEGADARVRYTLRANVREDLAKIPGRRPLLASGSAPNRKRGARGPAQ